MPSMLRMSGPVRRKSKIVVRKRSARAEQTLYWVRRIGIFGGLIVFTFWLGAWFVLSGTAGQTADTIERKILEASANNGFAVSNILVEGRVNTDPETLKAITNLRKGDPLLTFDPQTAKTSIEKLAWIENAEIQRRWPDTVYIRLKERRPLALWQHEGRLSLIAEDGTVLTDRELERFRQYPVVSGKNAPNKARQLLELVEAEPEIMERMESAALIAGRRWDIRLKSGVIVNLPENEIGLSLRRLATAQDNEGLLDKNIRAIDIREENRITVRTHPGTAREYKTGL